MAVCSTLAVALTLIAGSHSSLLVQISDGINDFPSGWVFLALPHLAIGSLNIQLPAPLKACAALSFTWPKIRESLHRLTAFPIKSREPVAAVYCRSAFNAAARVAPRAIFPLWAVHRAD